MDSAAVGGFMMIYLIMFLGSIVLAICVVIALWRMSKAHVVLAEAVEEIAREMGTRGGVHPSDRSL